MRIAVAGGTGLAGAATVAAVRSAGHEAIVLARSAGGDLVSGVGLAEALVEVDAVIDCSNTSAQDRSTTVGLFAQVARNLQAVARRAGVRRIVTLSIVGIDGCEGRAHYAGKLAQEAITRAGAARPSQAAIIDGPAAI